MSTRPDEIDVEVAHEFWQTGQAQFVDARPRLDFQRSGDRIPSAVHVDPGAGAELDECLRNLPRELLIIAYCDEPNHAASAQVARRARELGLGDASFLAGGLQAWLDAGLPTTASLDGAPPEAEAAPDDTSAAMTLSSPTLADDQPIPVAHAAEGDNLSPPLSWDGVPAAAKSLVLLFEDLGPGPSLSTRPQTLWVVYNLQPSTRRLDMNADREGLPARAHRGRNDFGHARYQGPDPELGRHRYRFHLLALDTMLDSDQLDEPGRGELMRALEGHLIAEAELTCFYQRHLDTADEAPLPP